MKTKTKLTPIFKNTENDSHVTKEGKTIWASRSVCVCIKLDLSINDIPMTLITKRGKAVSNEGKWCLPCGYIDKDETIIEGAIRELYEETGILVNESQLERYEIMDNPLNDSLQNITFHYRCKLTDNPFQLLDEVNAFIKDGYTNEESTLACLVTASTYMDYDYAFGHEQRVSV